MPKFELRLACCFGIGKHRFEIGVHRFEIGLDRFDIGAYCFEIGVHRFLCFLSFSHSWAP